MIPRRAFLMTAASSGVAATTRVARRSEPVLDDSGLTKQTVPTPALIVDIDALDANIRAMAEHSGRAGRGLRPHAKTHKCPMIARRQIAAGALGVCTATVEEAEAMVAAGIHGVLLTSPIVDAGKIGRMVDLNRRGASVMVAVGHSREATLLTEALESAGVRMSVLIDVDIGDKRTGSMPGAPAVELARQIARSKLATVSGVQAYAGHASHTVGFEAREKTSRDAMAKAVETRQMLEHAGFDATILSGGSTGTYNIDSAIAGVTELQVGSYIFMDVDYRRIGGRDGNSVYSDFAPSLSVITTVVSTTHADRVTVDAGTKAIDTTTAHRPECKTMRQLVYSRAGDEFGSVTADSAAALPKIGERLEFIIPHCDPTVNLYDRIHACRGNHVEEIWPILARRTAS